MCIFAQQKETTIRRVSCRWAAYTRAPVVEAGNPSSSCRADLTTALARRSTHSSIRATSPRTMKRSSRPSMNWTTRIIEVRTMETAMEVEAIKTSVKKRGMCDVFEKLWYTQQVPIFFLLFRLLSFYYFISGVWNSIPGERYFLSPVWDIFIPGERNFIQLILLLHNFLINRVILVFKIS